MSLAFQHFSLGFFICPISKRFAHGGGMGFLCKAYASVGVVVVMSALLRVGGGVFLIGSCMALDAAFGAAMGTFYGGLIALFAPIFLYAALHRLWRIAVIGVDLSVATFLYSY